MAKLTETRIERLERATAPTVRYRYVDLWQNPDGSDQWATAPDGSDFAPFDEQAARHGPNTILVCHAR